MHRAARQEGSYNSDGTTDAEDSGTAADGIDAAKCTDDVAGTGKDDDAVADVEAKIDGAAENEAIDDDEVATKDGGVRTSFDFSPE